MKNCAGFTLIEAMVAFMILSYGLLGLAYIQTKSVQFGNESQNRTEINSIVADMIDRMRANQVLASSPTSSAYTDGISASDLGSTTCTSKSATVEEDMVCFYRKLESAIPTSNMQITTVDLDGDSNEESYQLTVFWSDQQLSQGDLDDGDEEKLIKQSDCVGANRTWSSTIPWPDDNRPDPGLCLLSHTWQFEVFAR